MQIVTDTGMDMTAEQREGLDFHYLPLTLTLDGKTYRSGIDIEPEAFYDILEASEGLPTTSLPSPGEFAKLYRRLAQDDPDILSVHISSGLSGTCNAAREGAQLVPKANIHIFDTLTLSGAEGWHVEAAARAAKAGWGIPETVELLEKVRAATDTLYTLATLKYLIHGGRISHIKGLVASVLRIKPLIAVSKDEGKYYQRGQTRTLPRAILNIADVIAEDFPRGAPLRVQVLHGKNPEGAEQLRERLDSMFECMWLPTSSIAPVLGAHTGPGLVGAAYAPMEEFPELP
ncbi:MAG: DegV family protein [Anaerolineales bacterium]